MLTLNLCVNPFLKRPNRYMLVHDVLLSVIEEVPM